MLSITEGSKTIINNVTEENLSELKKALSMDLKAPIPCQAKPIIIELHQLDDDNIFKLPELKKILQSITQNNKTPTGPISSMLSVKCWSVMSRGFEKEAIQELHAPWSVSYVQKHVTLPDKQNLPNKPNARILLVENVSFTKGNTMKK